MVKIGVNVEGETPAAGDLVQAHALDEAEEALADLLAKVAVRSIYVAVTKDPDLMARVQKNGKDTPEFRELSQREIPTQAYVWVKEDFWHDGGPVINNVRSQLKIALRRHRVGADFTKEGGVAYSVSGGGATASDADSGEEEPKCDPFCAGAEPGDGSGP